MSEYPVQKKVAVMAALLAGNSIRAVSRELNVPRSTVSRWKRAPVPFDGPQKNEFGELMLDSLRENLTALTGMARHFQNESWLNGQGAAGLAILYGVLCDKTIRMIELLSMLDSLAGDAGKR